MITARTLDEQLAEEAKSWELPIVDKKLYKGTHQTNALNRTEEWKYEPPEEEVVILPPTAEEIEEIRRAAYEEGFSQGQQEGMEKGYQEGLEKGQQEGHQQGLEAGHAEGLEQGQSEIAEQVAIWQQLMTTLHNPIASMERELQKELVALSVSLARSVVRHEVKTNSDIIFQALADGLKVLPIRENAYQIRMHPEDIELVKTQFSDEDIERHNWIFVEAPELSRGGCDIMTDNNAVDVTVERRCRDVLDRFLQEQGLSSEQVSE
ncbi:flagellar assembly protein FliH [Paraneptunicella aestuarii]|uniref:flagellar assembly protein FliH n=1 Tax=Paraneptunicella aestuarii TaxID=2831148 RepID=UPI001E3C07A5|nr:flagellar assembly protein FliH [Paraneptunicella aestuarii]UAA38167.1 flagellar assembly protein FliH [Paraneptunicella aestuarii]